MGETIGRKRTMRIDVWIIAAAHVVCVIFVLLVVVPLMFLILYGGYQLIRNHGGFDEFRYRKRGERRSKP